MRILYRKDKFLLAFYVYKEPAISGIRVRGKSRVKFGNEKFLSLFYIKSTCPSMITNFLTALKL